MINLVYINEITVSGLYGISFGAADVASISAYYFLFTINQFKRNTSSISFLSPLGLSFSGLEKWS